MKYLTTQGSRGFVKTFSFTLRTLKNTSVTYFIQTVHQIKSGNNNSIICGRDTFLFPLCLCLLFSERDLDQTSLKSWELRINSEPFGNYLQIFPPYVVLLIIDIKIVVKVTKVTRRSLSS